MSERALSRTGITGRVLVGARSTTLGYGSYVFKLVFRNAVPSLRLHKFYLLDRTQDVFFTLIGRVLAAPVVQKATWCAIPAGVDEARRCSFEPNRFPGTVRVSSIVPSGHFFLARAHPTLSSLPTHRH